MHEFIVKYLDDIGRVHTKTFRADSESQVWKQHEECSKFCSVISVKLKQKKNKENQPVQKQKKKKKKKYKLNYNLRVPMKESFNLKELRYPVDVQTFIDMTTL